MSWNYQAPIADMRFVIEHVLEAPGRWAQWLSDQAIDAQTAVAVLEEAARFASGQLLPINSVGDREGCRLDDARRVRTPQGFASAYRQFVEAGWPALPCDPQWGGQGLPMLIDAATREMLSACNHGWSMYPDLLHGAYETLRAHASDELKTRYLSKIVSGEWLAAMALTEPQAGSDLGLLRTRGEPRADGSLAITGDKIFISGGDHDLADNIIHLVLFRLPDAPAGARGVSLALVPAVLPDGSRNTLHCTGLEHKMGIHGSATCAMRYEAATGWLVGEPHRGLAAMFLMMNSARLHLGLQGLGHQEISTQNAVRYAMERRQGRSAASSGAGAAPIASHAAVRHLLLRRQALTEAQRVLAYRAAQALDPAAHDPDPAAFTRAAAMAGLLTPAIKALLTDQGFQGASEALQVFGGYGYVRDTGIEQSLRDSRIAMIYEGTNEIQAIDLLQRKVLGDGGRALAEWQHGVQTEAVRCEAAGLLEFSQMLRDTIQSMNDALTQVRERSATDNGCVPRVADDWLKGVSYAMLGWAFAVSARAASTHPDRQFVQQKLERMRYGLQWLMPQAAVHWTR
ncbi:MAG: acyl-CoA dehydrogenase family protein, partial [Betaproteobacteria bacterium]